MKIIHISTECYPAAKTGGLGDVVGSLPKYQKNLGISAQVIIPKYGIAWINAAETTVLRRLELVMGNETFEFQIEQLSKPDVGFDLLFVNIPRLFDRNGIYADDQGFFQDEFKRVIAFNRAFLQWLCTDQIAIDLIHCHDHHTGLVPFMMKYAYEYQFTKDVPTVFTIHNGKYQGWYSWRQSYLLPHFDPMYGGLIEWSGQINCLASGVKNSWKVTTVSESYMEELRHDSDGLEWLFNHERMKCIGILNGIDTDYWNPKTDEHIIYPLKSSISRYKERNKTYLGELIGVSANKCYISFIGRLVHEKGIDYLIYLYNHWCRYHPDSSIQFIILGTGADHFEHQLTELESSFKSKISLMLKYDEKLAHQIYAGSDYIFMPSRVEPCGLNQFYALRYGTVPIVRRIGGLADSVTDITINGNGIVFEEFNTVEGVTALEKATQLYDNKADFYRLREAIMEEDNSWDKSARKYEKVYLSIL